MHIDPWTLALQTVNVLILIWLLKKFLFRPVMEMVDSRQHEADKLLADAADARREAEQARAGLESARTGITEQRNKAIAEARAGADTARTTLMTQANEEIAKLRSDATAAVARDRAAMERAVIEHARDLALDIARRLLSRAGPTAAVDGFLPGLSDQLKALPPHDRALFTEPGDVEVVTAAPLGDDARERVRHAVTAAVAGGTAALVFRTDPAVIAGVELRTRHGAVRNSWRSDLDEIAATLDRTDTATAARAAAAPAS